MAEGLDAGTGGVSLGLGSVLWMYWVGAADVGTLETDVLQR